MLQDNSKKVLTAFDIAMQNALNAIGSRAEAYAKMACPVDTGRLRNSLTYATATKVGDGDSSPKSAPEKTAAYVGSNVEYAPYVEFLSMSHKTGRAHFLRDAATTHGEEYRRIAEAAMRGV